MRTKTHFGLSLVKDEIKSIAEAHAFEWGESVIGKCVLKNTEPPKHDGKFVLCCIYTYRGDDIHKHLLVVTKGDTENKCWWENFEFVEGRVLDEWDVI
jgi:hypothetical protein